MYVGKQCHSSQRAGYQELVGGSVPLKMVNTIEVYVMQIRNFNNELRTANILFSSLFRNFRITRS